MEIISKLPGPVASADVRSEAVILSVVVGSLTASIVDDMKLAIFAWFYGTCLSVQIYWF